MNSNILLHLVSQVMRHKSKIYGVANATLKNPNVFMRNYDAVKFKLPHLRYVLLAFIWPLKKNKPMEIEVKNPDTIESVLKSADDLFDSSNYEKCFQLLNKKELTDNVEAQWRLCRLFYNMSKDATNATEKRDLIENAYSLISKLIEEHSDHFAVHKWYALILDERGAQQSIKERIKQLEIVKKHMDKAVALNPKDATTLHMLGEWCYQLASMPWHQRIIAQTLFASPPESTFEEALDYFLRAESVQPRFYSMNLLRLGDCYLKLKKDDQAKYYLNLAAMYPAKSNDDLTANKEAAKLLKKLHSPYKSAEKENTLA